MRRFRITVNGEVFEVAVEEIGTSPGSPANQPAPQPQKAVEKMAPIAQPKAQPAVSPLRAVPVDDGHSIVAPLPGTVLDIKVSVGKQVNVGDVVLILEAMKMENEVTADTAGQVKEILVDKGAAVGAGDPLIAIG